LHELATNAEQCSTTETLWTGFEEGKEAGPACCRSLFFQCVFNFMHSSVDNRVILGH
jgi:hypothetical protein